MTSRYHNEKFRRRRRRRRSTILLYSNKIGRVCRCVPRPVLRGVRGARAKGRISLRLQLRRCGRVRRFRHRMEPDTRIRHR